MNPLDFNQDFCVLEEDAVNIKSVTATGAHRIAPMQPGNWAVEPHYCAALPILINPARDKVFSRMGHVHSQDHFDLTLSMSALRDATKNADEWFHALEILTPMQRASSHQIISAGQCLIIVDILKPELTYVERRKQLLPLFDVLGLAMRPIGGQLYLVPAFPETPFGMDIWFCMHEMNERFEDSLYSGIVMKHTESKYTINLDDPRKEDLLWHKFKFSHARP